MGRYVDAATTAEMISERHNIDLADLVDTFAEIPSADVVEVRHGEWISVEDRLPEFNEIVLGCLDRPRERLNYPYHERVLLLYFSEIYMEWRVPFSGDTHGCRGVTHWMPLPKLPMGKDGSSK